MRQLNQPTVYSELVCVIPGKGLQTLFRGKTYASVLAFRSNHALRRYQGGKVCAVERRTELKEPIGWVYKDKLQEVPHAGD